MYFNRTILLYQVLPYQSQVSFLCLGRYYSAFLFYMFFPPFPFVRGSHRIEILPSPHVASGFRHTPFAWRWSGGAGSKRWNKRWRVGENEWRGGVCVFCCIRIICACAKERRKKKKGKELPQQARPLHPCPLPMKMITTEGIRGRDCVRVPTTHLW